MLIVLIIAGVYTCKATNIIGTVNRDVSLEQVHKPGPVTDAKVRRLVLDSICKLVYVMQIMQVLSTFL